MAHAEEPRRLFPNECVDARVLDKGGVAQCLGLHVPLMQALHAIQVVDIELPAAREELRTTTEFYQRALERQEGLTQDAILAFDRLQAVITDRVTLPTVSWYERPVFWGISMFVLGTITGVAVGWWLNE